MAKLSGTWVLLNNKMSTKKGEDYLMRLFVDNGIDLNKIGIVDPGSG